MFKGFKELNSALSGMRQENRLSVTSCRLSVQADRKLENGNIQFLEQLIWLHLDMPYFQNMAYLSYLRSAWVVGWFKNKQLIWKWVKYFGSLTIFAKPIQVVCDYGK